MVEINQDDIKMLIEYFSRNMYRAKYSDNVCSDVMQKCLDLAMLDYSYVVVPNTNGELSAHYPSQLIIFEAEQPSGGVVHCSSTSTIYENYHDGLKLKELFGKARSARCRARFPIPVILFRGKNICRSSTLSGGPEIYGRSGLDYLFSNEEPDEDIGEADSKCHNWMLFDQVRQQDIKLLKVLGVGTIVDFMVEKKKVKFGVNVTSSEKVDKENRYNDFKILSLPYPGCEFFKQFRDNNYSAKDLVFDWEQSHVDADMIIPEDTMTLQLKIDWKDYKHWDLVTLTQNYLLLLLRYLSEGNSGLLIHCISGWDRTPLFISLLRISLWADGAIHKSLTPIQLLYFTIAYDWMLFGHNLEDRKTKGEDIFYFCFYILKNLTRDEFSINQCKGKPLLVNNNAANDSVSQPSVDAGLDGTDYDGGEIFISSQGSNISLNSSWSSISSKSQETPPVFVQAEDQSSISSGSIWYSPISQEQANDCNSTGKSSISSQPSSKSDGSSDSNHAVKPSTVARISHLSRTSPVAVPSRASLRSRNESSSSLSVGSWQFITGTGSLRGSGSNSTCSSNLHSNSSNMSLCDGQVSTESTNTLTADEDGLSLSLSFDHSSCNSVCNMRKERLTQLRELFCGCYCKSIGHNLKDGSEGSSGLSYVFGNMFSSNQRTTV